MFDSYTLGILIIKYEKKDRFWMSLGQLNIGRKNCICLSNRLLLLFSFLLFSERGKKYDKWSESILTSWSGISVLTDLLRPKIRIKGIRYDWERKKTEWKRQKNWILKDFLIEIFFDFARLFHSFFLSSSLGFVHAFWLSLILHYDDKGRKIFIIKSYRLNWFLFSFFASISTLLLTMSFPFSSVYLRKREKKHIRATLIVIFESEFFSYLIWVFCCPIITYTY